MPLSGNLTQNYTQTIEIASRTLIVGDAFNLLYSNNGALVFTIDAGIFSDGIQISLCDFDGGLPVFAAGVDTVLNTSGGLGPSAQFTVVSIIKIPTELNVTFGVEEWIVVGSV